MLNPQPLTFITDSLIHLFFWHTNSHLILFYPSIDEFAAPVSYSQITNPLNFFVPNPVHSA